MAIEIKEVDGNNEGCYDGVVRIMCENKGCTKYLVAMGCEDDVFFSLNDCLKEVCYDREEGGVVIVIIDNALQGDVYKYNSYGDGKWYKYGETGGYA